LRATAPPLLTMRSTTACVAGAVDIEKTIHHLIAIRGAMMTIGMGKVP
jgi:hypothetical protein